MNSYDDDDDNAKAIALSLCDNEYNELNNESRIKSNTFIQYHLII